VNTTTSRSLPRHPLLAGLLSLLWSGLGQIYNGQIAKGLALMVLYFLAWMLVGRPIGLIAVPGLLLYGIWDAYRSSARTNLWSARPQA